MFRSELMKNCLLHFRGTLGGAGEFSVSVSHPAAHEAEIKAESNNMKLGAKLDDLIAENLYPVTLSANNYDGAGSKHSRLGPLSTKNGLTIVDKHVDVHEDEGYITIPCSTPLLIFLFNSTFFITK